MVLFLCRTLTNTASQGRDKTNCESTAIHHIMPLKMPGMATNGKEVGNKCF